MEYRCFYFGIKNSMVKIDLIKVNFIVYDFDGVMNNNKVYVNQNGNETGRWGG